MSIIIESKKLETEFRVKKLDSIKNVCGYDIKDFPSEFEYFHLTPHLINGKEPTLTEVNEVLTKVIPELIELMQGQNQCVIQFNGSIEDGELPDLFPYILTRESYSRYYCPEIAKDYYSANESFIESWISFDFKKEKLKETPFNEAAIIISGIIVEKNFSNFYDIFFRKCWFEKSFVESELKKCLIFFSTDTDFEYFSVATKVSMDNIIEKWKEGLKQFDKT